ncbi:class I adenylate-forming enzyme family protein [Paracoccus pantotrophus]|uniref:class I adenylate-forming enzyme family protein n=1 Tax=Paracoccus pantotrophus TaxID=82367 RepID=UPI00048A697E|nr:class I adenylate-forming enzyme family protein [Paracoccus pantotrophus]
MTPEPRQFWSKSITTETIGGIPYRIYADRPQRISELLSFASFWNQCPYVIQGNRVLTFAGLLAASETRARHLQLAGIDAGDRVMILGWNSPDWVINFWAIVRLGAVPVLGNAWWSPGEIVYAIDFTAPKLVLADERCAGKVPEALVNVAWSGEDKAEGELVATIPAEENDPAVIIFTSGTEGRAKAVVLAHRSFIASMMMMMHITRRLPYDVATPKSEICLHTGPLFHIGGPHAMLRGVVSGNTLVFPSGRFSTSEALELIEKHRIERWTAVPTMLTRLLDDEGIAARDLSSLRSIGMGGAPVHRELLERVRKQLPGVDARVAIGYGLSENAGQATAASAENALRKPGSSGRPLPLVEIRFEEREGLPDGEILLRSPTQMLGYYGNPDSPIDADGWLHTGDLGKLDDEGLLWITGRCKDIIIRGGENIAPAAVERALTGIPAVAEAAVLGVPHPDLGEEVAAFVVIREDAEATAETLSAELRRTLASFAVPSRWHIQYEPLPTNQTGKVERKALLELLREGPQPGE